MCTQGIFEMVKHDISEKEKSRKTLYIDDDILEAVRHCAFQENVTESAIFIQAVKRYLVVFGSGIEVKVSENNKAVYKVVNIINQEIIDKINELWCEIQGCKFLVRDLDTGIVWSLWSPPHDKWDCQCCKEGTYGQQKRSSDRFDPRTDQRSYKVFDREHAIMKVNADWWKKLSEKEKDIVRIWVGNDQQYQNMKSTISRANKQFGQDNWEGTKFTGKIIFLGNTYCFYNRQWINFL